MKRMILGIFLIGMLVGNVVLFAQSVLLSDKIAQLELETRTLKTQNEELSQKLYTQDSLTQLSLVAEQLGFTKQAEPFYLDSKEYALVQ